MLDEISIRDAAKRLDESERARTQIRQLSIQHPSMNIDDAYAVQKAWVELKTSAGRVVQGHKIGLTSKAMQAVAPRAALPSSAPARGTTSTLARRPRELRSISPAGPRAPFAWGRRRARPRFSARD